MRRLMAIIIGTLLNLVVSNGQVNLIGFDFEDLDQTSDFGLAANSSETIIENNGASVSFPEGNNPTAGESFSTNNWVSGEYIVFEVSTVGLTNLNLEFDVNSSNTGPRDFKISYSTSGMNGPFTDIAGATFQSPTSFGVNPMFSFALPVASENQADLAIRIECTSDTSANGGSIGSTGTFKLDNLKLYSEDYTFVINEFLADPDVDTGDANNDGIVNTADDEFIEFINTSSHPVEISNWTIHDETGESYRFEYYSEIPSGESVVVFAGGAPTGITGTVFTAGSGWNALNNNGDDIILYDRFGNVIDSYTYGNEGGDNQSLARDPDITGSFVKHTTIVTNPVAFSPGKDNTDGGALPVELTSFNAEFVDNSVRLVWETATEVNNAGFQVQRQNSESGTQNSEWEVLTFIPGHASSNSPKEYSFIDDNLPDADNVSYRLKQIDIDGTFSYSKVVEVNLTEITGVEDDKQYTFALEQNYPNPFNPVTTISYTIPNVVDAKSASVTNTKLIVYNILGQQVRTLVNEIKPAGNYQVQFDGSNLPSGIYFYTLSYGEFLQTRKLVLLK